MQQCKKSLKSDFLLGKLVNTMHKVNERTLSYDLTSSVPRRSTRTCSLFKNVQNVVILVQSEIIDLCFQQRGGGLKEKGGLFFLFPKREGLLERGG